MAVACTYRVYSQEGVELRQRCEALKRWFEDFTRLGEAVPSDLVLWDRLLVMAVALGVSDEVLRQLAEAVPRELREDAQGGYYFPVYWWLYPHGGLHSPVHELGHIQTVSMGALASSLDSSGAGLGGGFSVGGGGGGGGGFWSGLFLAAAVGWRGGKKRCLSLFSQVGKKCLSLFSRCSALVGKKCLSLFSHRASVVRGSA